MASFVDITKVGQWRTARLSLDLLVFRGIPAVSQALKDEGKFFAKHLKKNLLKGGAPSGQPFEKLKKSTLDTRKLRGVRGRRPLIARGDMLKAITVKKAGTLAVFIGIPRGAKGRDGRSLAKIGATHELGEPTIKIPVTPAMSKFFALLIKAGGGRGLTGRGKRKVIIVTIPKRPFMMPVFDKLYSNPAVVQSRFMLRVATNMGGIFSAFGAPET